MTTTEQTKIHNLYIIQGEGGLYVGVTSDFRMRCYAHKRQAKINTTVPLYRYIQEHGGMDHFQIISLRRWECTRTEAIQAECNCIRELGANLNTYRGSETGSQRIDLAEFRAHGHTTMTPEDIKAYKKQYNAMWRETNREKDRAYMKKWHEEHPGYARERREARQFINEPAPVPAPSE